MHTIWSLFFAAMQFANAGAFAPRDPVREAGAVLNDWHDAAAKADFSRYFSHFADNAVFLGTDGSERWTLSEFKTYAKPYFDKGTAWTLIPKSRRLAFSKDRGMAWFDEDVESSKYGPMRGTGVLAREGKTWKVVQYSLSLPIPNDRFLDVLKLIAAPKSAEPAKTQGMKQSK